MTDEMVEKVAILLRRGPHSFEWFRQRTDLKFSDMEFRRLIRDNPNKFKYIRIASRDKEGNKVYGGPPGIKLLRRPQLAGDPA